MLYKRLEKEDMKLMKGFVKDNGVRYTDKDLKPFIDNGDTIGFVIRDICNGKKIVVGFACGSIVDTNDKKKVFNVDMIEIMDSHRDSSFEDKFMGYIDRYIMNRYYRNNKRYDREKMGVTMLKC